ncbi:hypothetical protein [Nostoc sphaeroides]|uniref:hypothetical protein n=1 Tax=Nostoc sphaeroides TaxID=446679 RepID=UPI000E46AA58|nr:hypothetical protein [Nostoc sphaeroides]MCC5630101.1 hypothetical protein [Nostoc sphaeroides CHAB 2801]
MFRLSDARNFLILTCLFSLFCYDANSSSVATSIENQPRLIVAGACNINLDPKTSEFKLVSPITVSGQSQRARCIIRISPSNPQKQVRLVFLALKGEVKKAPARVAISSLLIGNQPTPSRVLYQSPLYGSSIKFDLTDKILPTNYTTNGVFGINLILRTDGGELELTDLKFRLEQK